jgi:hypothetical protein
MIKLSRIKINDTNRILPDAEALEQLRKILARNFGSSDILFEYEEIKEGE